MATLFLLSFSDMAFSAVLYVDGEFGNYPVDCQGGDSWENAFREIQSAVDCADPGDEIWVKVGLYALSDTITVEMPIEIYGGFAGWETQRSERDWQDNITIVNGQYDSGKEFPCFKLVSSAVIDGFTITNGGYGLGGGITIPANDVNQDSIMPIIRNCILSDNHGMGAGGIGISCDLAHIMNCVFMNNWSYSGGAIRIFGGAQIHDCSFIGNNGEGSGSAIRNDGDAVITKFTFYNNSNYGGGGVINNAGRGTMEIYNCIIKNNLSKGQQAFGLALNNRGVTKIINCSIYGNFANQNEAVGGAISNSGQS